MSVLLKAARRRITRRLRRSVIGTCVVSAIDNQLEKLRLIRGDICSDSGAFHIGQDVDASLDYIAHVHAEYLMSAGIERFHGRVAEVGPGDNCGVALTVLADGARSVDLVDRFYADRDAGHNTALYKALITKYPALRHFADLLCESDFKSTFAITACSPTMISLS